MSNLILCFLEIPKIFICVRAFLLVSSLQFYTLEIRERKAYRKQMGSNVTVLLNFSSWPIQAGSTPHCLMIICKYLSLSQKLYYERSVLNTYQVVSLFQWYK